MTQENFLDRALLSIEQGIAEVSFTRPDKMNALDNASFDALCQVSAALKDRTDVRAVVVYGTGNSFCSGLDMSMFTDPNASLDLIDRSHGMCNRYQQAVWGWRELPVPVVAAINGYCLGGGLQIALGADVRIAHPESQYSVMEMQWGLIPDMAFSVIGPHLLRDDVLRDLVYTGRKLGAEEALDLGLITRLSDDPLTAAREYAKNISQMNPNAIRVAKAMINDLWPEADEHFKTESEGMASLMKTPNQIEAVMARMEKREPKFKDPA